METVLWWWWAIPIYLFMLGWKEEYNDWVIPLWFTALGMVIGHILNIPMLGLWWWGFPVFLILKGAFFVRDTNSTFMLWFTAFGSIIGYYLQ